MFFKTLPSAHRFTIAHSNTQMLKTRNKNTILTELLNYESARPIVDKFESLLE